jgi:large subunit ribosomal protein L25
MARLKATKREALGTRKVRPLREQGKIPAVVYGHGEAAVPLTLDEHEIELALMHGERLLELDVDGEKQNCLFKEVQYDTFGQEVLHVDLARVSLDERVEVSVPIELRGTPVGAEEGGVLQQLAAEVQIECLVTAIPEEIRVSVNDMKIDDVIYMRDLPLPDGVELLDEPDSIVCSVSVVAEEEVEEAEVAEETAAEPEVIGAKPEEEAQGAGEAEKEQ